MSTSFNCPACNGGPYRSNRGLQQHLTKSPQCALMEFQSCSSPLRPDDPSIPSVDSGTAPEPPAVYPDEESPGSNRKATDVVDLLVKHFMDEASDRRDTDPTQFHNIVDEDSFPFFMDHGECFPTGVEVHSSKAYNVNTPSTVDLPDCIKEAMFKPEPGFGPKYLEESLFSGSGVQYAAKMWKTMQPEEKSSISLLKILKGKEIGLFDQIMKWRWKSHNEYGHHVLPKTVAPTRKNCMRRLMETYGYKYLIPQEISIKLPNTGIITTMQRYPFGHMLASLLTDPVAMQTCNLSINIDNPFQVPPTATKGGEVGDLNTAMLHRMAWERLCRGKPGRLLCEILLFVDKTHLDNKGKHTLEPIMFTLGIFNKEFRNKPEAWRPLGYLPNLDHAAAHDTTLKKQMDYHYLCRILLSELVSYQELDGINWTFNFGKNSDCRAILEIPVICLMSDNEGHDKACARIVNRQASSSRGLCRYCNCPRHMIHDPMKGSKSSKTLCGPIRSLRNKIPEGDERAIEQLDKMDYKPFHDGFVTLHFSDPIRALHGCCPAELLHTFQMGIAERSIQSAFNIRRLKKGTKDTKKGTNKLPRIEEYEIIDDEMSDLDNGENEASDDETFLDISDSTTSVYESVIEEGSVLDPAEVKKKGSSLLVFNKKAKMRVDLLSRRLHRYLRWQSETNMPRTAFNQGITSLVKMQGAERTGVLIVLFLIMIMEHWGDYERDPKAKGDPEDIPGYIERSMGLSVAKNIVKSLYLLITFESFLRSDSIPYNCLGKVESFMPVFLDQIFRAFPRQEGSGHTLVKNHLFLHLVHDIRRLGVPSNTNSAIGETTHKVICKEPGRRTNMSADTFERQTSMRYVENLTILRAFRDHPEWINDHIPEEDIKTTKNEFGSSSYHCSVTKVGSNYTTGRNGKKLFGQIPNWSDSAVSSQDVIHLIRKKVLSNLKSTNEIELFGKTRRKGISFSCCPSYGSQGLAKQDWCFMEMEDGDVTPFHLLLIFFLPESPEQSIYINGNEISEKGYYALGHFAFQTLTDTGESLYPGENSNEGNRAHVDQYLVHRMPKWHLSDDRSPGRPSSRAFPPTISIISCDCIEGPCVAFPDIVSADPDNLFYFLKPVSKWGQLFIEEAERHYNENKT
jgi:hypothetical protein